MYRISETKGNHIYTNIKFFSYFTKKYCCEKIGKESETIPYFTLKALFALVIFKLLP